MNAKGQHDETDREDEGSFRELLETLGLVRCDRCPEWYSYEQGRWLTLVTPPRALLVCPDCYEERDRKQVIE